MYPSRIRWAEVVEQARLVITAYEGGVTSRQCFYRLAVAGVIPNTAAAYRKLSAHLAEARRRPLVTRQCILFGYPPVEKTLRPAETSIPPEVRRGDDVNGVSGLG
jgi:hypothetical protein